MHDCIEKEKGKDQIKGKAVTSAAASRALQEHPEGRGAACYPYLRERVNEEFLINVCCTLTFYYDFFY